MTSSANMPTVSTPSSASWVTVSWMSNDDPSSRYALPLKVVGILPMFVNAVLSSACPCAAIRSVIAIPRRLLPAPQARNVDRKAGLAKARRPFRRTANGIARLPISSRDTVAGSSSSGPAGASSAMHTPIGASPKVSPRSSGHAPLVGWQAHMEESVLTHPALNESIRNVNAACR